MPTGYTAKLYEGTPQTFEEFVLAAAHGMGALIEMRDSSMEAPIPVFTPSKYSAERLEKARAALDALQGHDLEWWVRRQRDEAESIAKLEAEAEERRDSLRVRYEAMLAQVEAWVPPTEDHVGLKDFMRQQLTSSIEFDVGVSSGLKSTPRTVGEYRVQTIAWAEKEVLAASDALWDERERVRGRNAWVDALFVSLGISREGVRADG